jgi:TolB-like protein/Flp pilus assembly protein TadD
VIGLAVLGGGLLYALRGEPGTASSTSVVTDPTRVAVLPFENLGDSADAYFADGVTDAVRGKLTGLAGLEVIARSSSEPYRGSMKALQQIAQELGVHYLLTGTVRWAKGPDGSSRVQVRPELVEVGDGTARSRWQEPFDAPLTDVFQVQSEIASQVAGALDVALGVSERQELAERPTRDLAAYDAYLKGQAIPGTDIESLRRAIAFFEQAVALDSSFGVAWGRLAGSLAMLHRHTRTNSLLAPITEALARARRLAPNAVDTYDARSYYESVVRSDNAAALAVVEEGLKRHPASPELLRTAGSLEIALGRVDSGVARMQRAMAMDPRSVRAARALGSQLVLLHRWRGARESYARAAAIVPGDLQALVGLIHAHLGEGDLVGARRVIDEAPPTTDRLQLFANLTIYGDLYWVLSRAQQDTVLALPASYFDDDRGSRALGFAQIFHQRGDVASARLWADSARIHFEARQRNETNPGQFPAVIGLALAYQGRYADAVVSAERGAGAATGVSTDRIVNYSREALARIHALGGDHARAVGRLQQLLPAQHNISPAWLRIDPAYVALHGDPGFERLTAGR